MILFAVALHLASCTVAGARARCGTFDRDGLALKLIVLPATERNASAIFPFNGGPGQPTTPGAELEVREFAAERRLHDVVLLDQRGTEGWLTCPKAVKAHEKEIIEGELFPPALVADCRREVEAHADPSHFTFDYFVDDVEAVRQALGYGPINIVGLSAGTRAALAFEAKYPKSLRSMLLYGPLPPENRSPLEFARDAQSVMDAVLPDPLELHKALAGLPADINSGGYTIHMTRGAFAEYLRFMLYTVERQSRLPKIVHDAAQRNWQAVAPGFINYRKYWYDDLGVFLSVTCPGDVRYISADEIAPATAGTFLGDYRIRRQIAACEQWTPGRAPRIHISNASVPILIFVGDRDAITPKRWADIIAHQAPRVRTIVFRNQGHGDIGPCAERLEAQFFDAESFEEINDSCAHSASAANAKPVHQELLAFATDYLGVDYIFWCDEEPYYSRDVLPMLAQLR